MGDWYLDQNEKWQYDPEAESPSPGVTALAPRPLEEETRSGFVKDDNSAYVRSDPDWFESYDDVDSRTVESVGGPDDAA